MRKKTRNQGLLAALVIGMLAAGAATADSDNGRNHTSEAQLGPRPFYLINGMDESKLKKKLLQCEKGPFYKTDFSIAHRGAPLQFPEHTQELLICIQY